MGNDRPRIAFLIAAHEHPELLARLVGRLESPWSEILVHVDAKVDQRPFEVALKGRSVTFVPRKWRVDVRWPGVGLCLATARLMRMASESAERLCHLSGRCYPATSLDSIRRHLASETEFTRVNRAIDFAVPSVINDYVRHFHFHDMPFMNPRMHHYPRLHNAVYGITRRFPRRPLREPPLFHGSALWALTRPAARSVLDYVDRNPGFLKWLRFSSSPSEIWVQSILKAGPHAGRISQDYAVSARPVKKDKYLHACHYIDWTANAASPKTLDIDDLPRIRASSALFVRKVHPVKSSNLLDVLDREAREQEDVARDGPVGRPAEASRPGGA